MICVKFASTVHLKEMKMNKMVLTVYSNNYDSYSYVVGRGMSGKVFIENGKSGKEFASVEKALDYVAKTNIQLDEIVYCYQLNGTQMFKKFPLVKQTTN